MDKTDIRILNLLSEQARMSASELSEKVNLSVSAVSERIRKLESAGVIRQYVALLDEKKLGLDVNAFMCVMMDHPRFNTKLIEYVRQSRAIVECSYLAGDYDFLLNIHTENSQSLERILDEIKSVPGVGRTKTMLVLSTAKQVYSTKIKEKE